MRVRSAKATRAHGPSLEELAQRPDGGARSPASASGSSAPSRSASQAVRRSRTERSSRSPCGRQLEPDAAPVDLRAHAHEQPGALEPVDVAGERGGGDRLRLGQRAERQAGARA